MGKRVCKFKPRMSLSVGAWHMLKQIMGFGNPTAGGFVTMAEALWAIGELNRELKERFGIELAVSAHWWHELLVAAHAEKVGHSAQWNNLRAINLEHWARGTESGMYPRIGRIIPPGFGLPGSDDGAFISPDPVRRVLAHDMMVLSFKAADWVIREGLGNGGVIYWTGPDGLRWKRMTNGQDVLLGHDRNPKLEEWGLIINGVGNAVREALNSVNNCRLLIEGKPAGDPCYLDVFTDTFLEILGINAINEVAGAKVAEWQGEFCHSRGAGQWFSEAMWQVIEASVFGGAIHLNSGGLSPVDFDTLLSLPEGVLMSFLPQYVDNDFLPGEGVPEWLDDQRRSIQRGAEWSGDTGQVFEVEFDARFSRYPDTIGALRKSVEFTVKTFEAAVADMTVEASAV